MLSGQKPYIDIDQSRKKFLFDGYLSICVRNYQIASLEENLSVVRKPSLRYALAKPFNKSIKEYWPKFNGNLKSIPVIFSHNSLYLLAL
jgi:hypothetical protein